MSRSNITPSTIGSPSYAYRHYYDKLDFGGRAPPASALPLPKCFRKSFSLSAPSSSGSETVGGDDIAKSGRETAEGDCERQDTANVIAYLTSRYMGLSDPRRKCASVASNTGKKGAE